MNNEILILILFLIAFCVLHSLLISDSVHAYIEKKHKNMVPWYRIMYNLISVLTLIPVLWYARSIQSEEIYHWSGYMLIPQALLISTGIAIIYLGSSGYSLMVFSGLHQLKNKRQENSLAGNEELNTSGIHGYIRHPWYTGVMILLWARNMDTSSLTVNIVFSLYFVVGGIMEERKLVRRYGEKYLEYRKRVSMFIPFKWLLMRK